MHFTGQLSVAISAEYLVILHTYFLCASQLVVFSQTEWLIWARGNAGS
jgi:hypothetical protein